MTVRNIDLLPRLCVLQVLNKAKEYPSIIPRFVGVLERRSIVVVNVFKEGKLGLMDDFLEKVDSTVGNRGY